MGAQRRQRGKPQHTGPHLRFSGCAGRRSARLSLLPFCQTASAFRLICLFHTFFRCGAYRAMVFAPLRCPKLFRFPFALFVGSSFQLFCSSLVYFIKGKSVFQDRATQDAPNSDRVATKPYLRQFWGSALTASNASVFIRTAEKFPPPIPAKKQ